MAGQRSFKPSRSGGSFWMVETRRERPNICLRRDRSPVPFGWIARLVWDCIL